MSAFLHKKMLEMQAVLEEKDRGVHQYCNRVVVGWKSRKYGRWLEMRTLAKT